MRGRSSSITPPRGSRERHREGDGGKKQEKSRRSLDMGGGGWQEPWQLIIWSIWQSEQQWVFQSSSLLFGPWRRVVEFIRKTICWRPLSSSLLSCVHCQTILLSLIIHLDGNFSPAAWSDAFTQIASFIQIRVLPYKTYLQPCYKIQQNISDLMGSNKNDGRHSSQQCHKKYLFYYNYYYYLMLDIDTLTYCISPPFKLTLWMF